MADNEQIEGAAISNSESTDDLDSLKARYADLEKKYGMLVNEKKKFAEDKKKLTENLKRWSGLEEEYGVEPGAAIESTDDFDSQGEVRRPREKVWNVGQREKEVRRGQEEADREPQALERARGGVRGRT
jgi:hypothetical protein